MLSTLNPFFNNQKGITLSGKKVIFYKEKSWNNETERTSSFSLSNYIYLCSSEQDERKFNSDINPNIQIVSSFKAGCLIHSIDPEILYKKISKALPVLSKMERL